MEEAQCWFDEGLRVWQLQLAQEYSDPAIQPPGLWRVMR